MVEIRPATPEDWPAIQALQERNAADIEFPVTFAGPDDAQWLVGVYKGQVASAVGMVDRPDQRQIMLLWNRGMAEGRASAALMNHVTQITKDRVLWFMGADSVSNSVRKSYAMRGFVRIVSNGQVSIYVHRG